jgi:hypothetical protein
MKKMFAALASTLLVTTAFAQTPASAGTPPAGADAKAPAKHAAAAHTKKTAHHKAHKTRAKKQASAAHTEKHAMTQDTGKGSRAAPAQTGGAKTGTTQAQ